MTQSALPAETRPGPKASLSRSEVITLAILGQWARFRNQSDFYRFAQQKLRAAFPTLPDRSQFNRLLRRHSKALWALSLHLVDLLEARKALYEVLDTSGVAVRNVKRRGSGWLAGMANIGWCTRVGWFNGFRLLLSSNPEGVITGFGFGAGSAKDQPLAETLLALRYQTTPAIASVGRPAVGPYLADIGFEGEENHRRWFLLYHAEVLCIPELSGKKICPTSWRRWLYGLRQIVETVYAHLMGFFRLDRDRPHDIVGFQVNLTAKVALHNFCIWLNKTLGRAPLAFADLLDW